MKQFFTFLVAMCFALAMNAQYIYNDFDGNQNESFSGWPNVPAIIPNPDVSGINTSPNVAEFLRSDWAQWDHVYTDLSGKVDFSTGTVFSVKVWSPIACDVLFKLEDKANGAIFCERLLSISTPNQWVQLDFDFGGEASLTYDKVVIFFDFATFNQNVFYFDDVEGPYYEGSQGKPYEAADVQDNFENNGWGTITDWIFQNPGLDPLPTTADPLDGSNTVADYNRTGTFEWTNAQAELAHRMDLTVRNVFEMDVYFPSSNDYSGPLSETVALKLQNSLLGPNAWQTQTEVIVTVPERDQWVTVTFDFSSVASNEDYDKIVVQFGGEGHWAPGQFYFDNIELLPWYPTPAYIYNDFDDNQNVDFEGYPNMPIIEFNPYPGGINTSPNSLVWLRSTDQWAHIYANLPGAVEFDNGTNFQMKVYSPVSCDVLLKLENQNDPGIFIEKTVTIWNANEWVLLNFDFPGAASDTYDKIVIFLDFASTENNIFYVDDIVGPEHFIPKPVSELNVQDNFEDDGWSTINYWILQDPNMDTMLVTLDPVDPNNHVADYTRSGTFEWANAQTILNHRLDLTERNKFELKVYFPSSNDYSQGTNKASVKLQNSLLGGNAWTTQAEVLHEVTVYDQWVTLLFDFEAWSTSIDYDQIVVQLGGEGNWVPGQFYFDDFYLKHVPEVTVLSPNGGETINQGESFTIEWDYAWWTGDIEIELMKGDQDPELITYNLPVSDTTYAWTVMTDQEPGSDYRIIVTSLTNEFPTDTSDSYFTIAEVTTIVPNFSASALDIAVGDSVMFSDNTTGSPTSWEWSFEGGTPSSYSGENPPYVTYSASGSFDVSLEVSDGLTTYVELKEDYIFVGEPPYADFTASETTILVGQTVDFTSNSTGDNLTYSWYFEGGTPETSTEENPMNILYSEAGFFNVELSVTNDYGESIMLREDYIEATGVGVIGLNDQTLSIWPNPAKDKIKISLPDDGVYTIKIIDLKGSSKIETVINNQFSEMDVSTLNSGLYLITVTDQNTFNTVSKKVIIN